MNDECTYRQWIAAFHGEDEHVKTLALAHLAAFGPVDPAELVKLTGFYRGVSAEFLENEVAIKGEKL